jgi:hypothetical protein
MVVRAYFPIEYSVVVSALLQCVKNEEKVNESVVAELMHLPPQLIATMLNKLFQNLLISHETVTVRRHPGYFDRNVYSHLIRIFHFIIGREGEGSERSHSASREAAPHVGH